MISNRLFLASPFELNTFARLCCKSEQTKENQVYVQESFVSVAWELQWLPAFCLDFSVMSVKGLVFQSLLFFHILCKVFFLSSSVSKREVSSASPKMCLELLEIKISCLT